MSRTTTLICCLLVAATTHTAARADSCILGPQPAASLLIPYFEVDLDQPAGRTTLLAVTNTSSDQSSIARLVLWTDWGLPTLAMDLSLGPRAIGTLNLRDLFAGKLAGDGSATLIRPETLDAATLQSLRAKHTGVADPAGGLCWSSPRSDETLATGYVTIDLIERSSRSVVFQSDFAYFRGPDPLASTDNRLTGDFFFVDSSETFAQGFEAAHLVARPERFAGGNGPSFYGAFVDGSGADARLPLSTHHRARFFVGSPAAAGTSLVVWLDDGRGAAAPQPCGGGPPWSQIGIPDLDLDGVDESGVGFKTFVRENPLRTQLLVVGADIPVPVTSGELDIRTQVRDALGAPPNFEAMQGWVAPIMSAFGQYSVGWNATRMDDGCVTLAE